MRKFVRTRDSGDIPEVVLCSFCDRVSVKMRNNGSFDKTSAIFALKARPNSQKFRVFWIPKFGIIFYKIIFSKLYKIIILKR